MIVVTGGCGFIGSNLVDLLVEKGETVAVIDNLSTGKLGNLNKSVFFCKTDLCQLSDEGTVLLSKARHVFHLAALPRIQPSFDDPIGYDDANVRATLKLIQCLDPHKCSGLTVSSSSSVYGTPKKYPTTESEPIAPLSPYALQKYASEQYALILCNRLGIRANALRYFNVYGPRSYDPTSKYNAYSSVVGIFARLARDNLPLTVTGNGTQERDFVHVYDVAVANYLTLINKNISDVFNVGTGNSISILDLAKKFSTDIKFIPERQGEALITRACVRKADQLLGWTPKINLDDAIMRESV